MECPNCQTTMQPDHYQNIPCDLCPKCGGMWFTPQELEGLEDEEMNKYAKGSRIHDATDSSRKCPKCHKLMQSFDYYLDDITLDYCDAGHGYYLDKGEADQVVAALKQEEHDAERMATEDNKWTSHLKHWTNPSFFDRLKERIEQ